MCSCDCKSRKLLRSSLFQSNSNQQHTDKQFIQLVIDALSLFLMYSPECRNLITVAPKTHHNPTIVAKSWL